MVQQNGGAVMRSPLPPQQLPQHLATLVPSSNGYKNVKVDYNTLRYPILQREGEERRSQKAVENAALGALIGSRAGVFGFLAGTALGATYGYLSGYSSYTNMHKIDYQSEKSAYNEWRQQQAEGQDAYESGDMYTYGPDTEHVIHSMICKAMVMYTYDINNRLRVSGNHDAIKHALLAEDKDVYAAGTASVVDEHKQKLEEGIGWAFTRASIEENMKGMKSDSAQMEDFIEQLAKARAELSALGYDANISVSELNQQHQDTPMLKANTKLSVDENSGHYHPQYDSGHKALEAWGNAGYKRIIWEPRWNKKRWYNLKVEEKEGESAIADLVVRSPIL